MGQRSSAETVTRLIFAFMSQPVWSQKDLAEHCGVGAKAIKARLTDLQAAGVPLDREEDRPQVYWSVPRGWLPQVGRVLAQVDIALLARMIARLPRSGDREQLLAKLLGRPQSNAANPGDPPESDELHLRLIEDASRRREVMCVDYYSASRGAWTTRTLSVQRIIYGRNARFVAYCHSTNEVLWFRVDRVTQVRPNRASSPFVQVPETEVDDFIGGSVDGYRYGHARVACLFRVLSPTAHWAVRNLPEGAEHAAVSHDAEGATVRLETAGLDVLARFLVGLGGAVQIVAPESLRTRVLELAQGAVSAHGAMLNNASVRPKRPARLRLRQTS